MKATLNLFLLLSFVLNSYSQNVTRWRGSNGNGKYDQSELLSEWPEEGPDKVWTIDGLGEGFSSPAFANSKIYLSGMIDSIGYISVYSESGEKVSQFPYGKEFTANYVGSRSTPTIVGDYIYIQSGEGEIFCLSEKNESVIWKKDVKKDFGGENLRFGISESLVVDGDIVFASPGGQKHNIVALNRITGEVVWSCEGKQTLSAYCTPLLFTHNGLKIITTMMADWILGIEANSGKLLWAHPYDNVRPNLPNTPIYHDGGLYCFSGYNNGGVKLQLSEDGRLVEQKWKSDSLQSKMGGAVLIDGYLYGSGDNKRCWYCLDWETGETIASHSELANGVVIAADNKLYLYTDRGEVALVKPDPQNYTVISKTMLAEGTAQHWAHPVIKDGKLYVRHGDALVVFQI